MNYVAPDNFRLRWSRIKRADLLRQYAVEKQTTFTRKVSNDALVLVMPSGINAACVDDGCYLYVYVYDAVGFYSIQLVSGWVRSVKFYKDARALAIEFLSRHPLINIMLSEHKKIIRAFHTLFVCRLRMRGRLYRIYKRNKFRDLQYRIGFSHYVTVQVSDLYVKYIRKKKIRIFGLDYYAVLSKVRQARDRFPVCKYTQRGVRLGGDRCFAKIGKTAKYY